MDNSELHRHRCEVRQVLAWRVEHGLEWVRAWLDDAGRKRGYQIERLRTDCSAQWKLGNRGERGDWR